MSNAQSIELEYLKKIFAKLISVEDRLREMEKKTLQLGLACERAFQMTKHDGYAKATKVPGTDSYDLDDQDEYGWRLGAKWAPTAGEKPTAVRWPCGITVTGARALDEYAAFAFRAASACSAARARGGGHCPGSTRRLALGTWRRRCWGVEGGLRGGFHRGFQGG